MGFDSVWVTDDIVREYSATLDPLVSLALVAGCTSTVKLGTAVLVIPAHSPVLLARALASLDHLSGGRLIVGVGIGHGRREMEALGVDWQSRGKRGEEIIMALRSLWIDKQADFEGSFFFFKSLRILPRPKRRIPIWIGGEKGAALRRAALLGDGWIASAYRGSVSAISASLKELALMAREVGRNPEEITLASNVYLHISRDKDKALKEAVSHFQLRYGSISPSYLEEIGVFGSVDECVQKLQRRVDVGIRYFNLVLIGDGISELERAGGEILPSFLRR